MGRPPKAADVLEAEGKSHRTKAEMEQRRSGEKAALTGRKIKEFAETKADGVAHGEFLRVTRLLTAAGKNDALYETVINRYACLRSEELAFLRAQRDAMAEGDLDTAMSVDKQVAQKRRAMFDIEKECGMTLASAMRNVPRKPEAAKDALVDALGL